jgi:hypothetical protein
MSKRTVFTTFLLGGAVTAALSACDVQVHDMTPATYPANHDIGMYEIKATVASDAMVSPGSVYLRGLSGKQRIDMTPNRTGTEWHGMYSIRCQASFPLQILAVWKLQGLTTEQKVVPAQPREIKLVEPEPTKEATVDTTGDPKKPPKGGWQGTVKYRFATEQNTQITGVRIDPVSTDPADVAAAKAIAVTTPMPLDIPCGVPTELTVASTAQRAQANLVIDSNHPAFTHWTTKVVFAPK